MTDRIPDFVRFMSFVRTGLVADCWFWWGNRPSGCYGHFCCDGKTVKAHRWIYEFLNGPIPDSLVLRHRCDNPACVNPMHLETGTLSQNAQDAIERGRWSDRKGTKHPMASLTERQVLAIRNLAACGVTQKKIAYEYQISRQHVGKIVRRENWSHV